MRFLKRFHLRNVLGLKGENEAEQYLRGLGWKILERNYRNKKGKAFGEIDIVAREGERIIFVEVKARTIRTNQLEEECFPEENITREKVRKLGRITELWMKERGMIGLMYRIDSLAIFFFEDGRKPKIRHIQDIFF